MAPLRRLVTLRRGARTNMGLSARGLVKTPRNRFELRSQAKNGVNGWEHPVYGDNMNTRITLDSAGRVVIPKGLREELHLQPGDELDLEASDEQITLRPVREAPPLSKEQGIWVFRTGHPLPASATDDVLQRGRRGRDRENLGRGK